SQWAPPLKYQMQLSLTNDFTNPILNVTDIDGLSYKVQGLSGGVSYYSRERSYTSEGSYSEYSAIGSFTVNRDNGTLAVTPTLSYPTGGITVYTTSPILNWYIGGYSPDEKYQLQVSTKPDFSYFVLNQDDITSIQYQINGLSNGVTYYTRVRGKAQDGTYSLFSSTGQFTVYAGDSPVVPVAASPSGGIMVQSGSAALSWYCPANITSVQTYDLQVSTKPDFSDLTQVTTGIDSASYMIKDLKSETKYFWRVRSKTEDGKTSQFSNEGNFITSKLTNIALQRDNLIPKEYILRQNYPNPFNPATTIEFSVPKDEWVRLQVFDMLGKVAKEFVNESLSAGNYKISFNAEELASGVYIYKLTTPSVNITKKMILQK
ncbi:MAG: T9SS type A sorting domain-containing protein, partial [Methanococcaceae archaeon]